MTLAYCKAIELSTAEVIALWFDNQHFYFGPYKARVFLNKKFFLKCSLPHFRKLSTIFVKMFVPWLKKISCRNLPKAFHFVGCTSQLSKNRRKSQWEAFVFLLQKPYVHKFIFKISLINLFSFFHCHYV